MTSTVAPDLQALLGDRYRIEREIARGGMATVYLADDLRHDRQVALKVMHPEVALALGRERFLREIRLTAKLSHPNILTIHDSGEAGEYLWYVMPFVDGETLRQRLEKNGPLAVDEVLRLTREAAEAIGYAHSLGVVHRDIKPENILLSRGHAVIADFGIARAIDAARDDRLTATGSALGTTAYMSPEQALAEDVDARTDVWALGCVMYEMLCGKPPFGSGGREVITRALTGSADPIRAARPDVPDEIERIVSRAIERDKADRFVDASELAAALDGNRTGARAAPKMRPRISPARMAGAATTMLIVIVAAAAIVTSQRGSRRTAPPSARRAVMSTDSLAREFYRQGQIQQARRTGEGWAQAISLYSRAIGRDSSFAMAWAELARTANFAYSRGSGVPGISNDSLLALSVKATERATILAPDDPATWLLRARTARLMDPADNAPRLFALRKSLALDSTYVPAWFELGVAFQDQLDDSAALAAWVHAARLDASNAEVLSFIALHYVWTGEYEKGVTWADSAVNLDPSYVLARDATGQLAFELGRIASSLRQFEIQSRLNKGREQGNSFAMMARALAALGDTAKAREYLKRAADLVDMKHPVKHEAVWVGAGLAAVGDTVGAIRLLKAYQPRDDLHFQLHLKRDPGLKWLRGKWGKDLLTPDPPKG
ncbi:MAG TPA: serine/threonine-protein kinase [Gemmatimonadaceae bacterium]|nr:serine/threonine-protein kinase [Gemmatimonadaceae bacterium]